MNLQLCFINNSESEEEEEEDKEKKEVSNDILFSFTLLHCRFWNVTNKYICVYHVYKKKVYSKMVFHSQLNKSSRKQMQQPQQHSSNASSAKAKSGGFKKEVKAALSMLRHKLRLEQKQVIIHQYFDSLSPQ